MKKKWVTARLIILCRSEAAEAVLVACKDWGLPSTDFYTEDYVCDGYG